MMANPALQSAARSAIVRQPEEGTVFSPPSGPQVMKVTRADTEGAFEIVEIEVVPNAGPPLHVHPKFDEAFYVIEGTLTLRIGEKFVNLPARGSALVPAGTVHTWTNRGTSPARFLQITVPGSMEALLAAVAANPPANLEEFARMSEPLGTLVVGPPL